MVESSLSDQSMAAFEMQQEWSKEDLLKSMHEGRLEMCQHLIE